MLKEKMKQKTSSGAVVETKMEGTVLSRGRLKLRWKDTVSRDTKAWSFVLLSHVCNAYFHFPHSIFTLAC